MRAFVTGGSGFVGRTLIQKLIDRGDQVSALARSDRAADAAENAGAHAVIRGDLHAVEAMRSGMQGCDVVFHCAALVSDWGDPADFYEVNVEGTRNVIDAAMRAEVPRLVHVSSEAVLAGRPIVDIDETAKRPARPVGLYPRTKAMAEDLVLAACSDKLATVVVRPRLIWGRGDTSLLPQIIDAIEDGRFRWINGGRYRTSTCHVNNVVEGMLLAAERGEPGEIYFLTDGEPVEFREFIGKLLAAQGVEPGNQSVPRWLAQGLAWSSEALWRVLRVKRPPPITRAAIKLIGEEVVVDDSKARETLDYRASTSMEQGLAEISEAAKR